MTLSRNKIGDLTAHRDHDRTRTERRLGLSLLVGLGALTASALMSTVPVTGPSPLGVETVTMTHLFDVSQGVRRL